MNRIVRICGTAPNLMDAAPAAPGSEVWCCNNPKDYSKTRPAVRDEFSRWFNLHSERHMRATYPEAVRWYGQQTAPKQIVLQQPLADIPQSVEFPKDKLLALAGHRFITFSGAWLMLFAEASGFTRVDMVGFEISPRKAKYVTERACFYYWVNRLRAKGIDLTYPAIVDNGPCEPGDPLAYDGPLYGYETT